MVNTLTPPPACSLPAEGAFHTHSGVWKQTSPEKEIEDKPLYRLRHHTTASVEVLINITSSLYPHNLCDFPLYKHGEHVVKRADTVRGSAMNSSAFILAIRHPACLYIDPNPRPQYICQWISVCVSTKERDRETGN